MSFAVMCYLLAVQSGGVAPSGKSPRHGKVARPAARSPRAVVKAPPAPRASEEEDAERWDGMS